MTAEWDVKKLRARFLDDHMRTTSRQTLSVVAHMLILIDRDDDILDIGH